MGVGRKDAWSPAFVIATATSTAAFVLFAQFSIWTMLLSILFVFSALVVIVVCLCIDLYKRRVRHALSIAAAIILAFAIIYNAPLIAQGKNKIAFYSRQSEFMHQVEDARAKQTKRGPLQIVVDYEDQSLFVTANSFYYLIYDETDGAGPYEEASWPYAKSPTGMIAVTVPDKLQHIAGHFYSFQTSY